MNAHKNFSEINKDASKILAGYGNGKIILFENNILLSLYWEISAHGKWIRQAIFSNNEDMIISVSHDKSIKIWNAQGQHMKTIEGHEDSVICVDIT